MSAKKKVEKVPKWAEGLTAKERKRVEVWRDVVARIKAKRMVVEQGVYLSSDWDMKEIPTGEEIELQAHIGKLEGCKVCAKGALFLSHVDKFDRCKLVVEVESNPDEDGSTVNLANGTNCSFNPTYNGFGIGNTGICETLAGTFTREQLELVEYAFEMGECGNPKRLAEEAWKFGAKYEDDSEARLLAIAKNAIRNRGTFVPPKVK